MHTKIALIKIRHGPHKFVLNAIPKINDLGGKTAKLKIIYVGATMKHCFIFIKVNIKILMKHLLRLDDYY